ncbi:CBS domain-containing protein, partial [Chryseobacterium sp. HMWF001]
VGMAGAMSGVMYAPLTAIFLIAESSFGYDLFIPLMIVSIISYLIAKWFSPISPELKSLADQGKIFTNKHDKNILFSLKTEEFIDRYSQAIDENAPITELFELVKNGSKNIFAVVNEEKVLRGILTLDDIRPYLFANNEVSVTPIQMMKAPPAIIHPEDQPLDILQTFDDTGVWNLPVVDANNRFIGFISKSTILMSYRQLLKEYSE